ncbi:MAG: hypothetical protein SOZ34_07020 [Clostridia bacterium]|nr:hypothetical protein [Clostridia bacterium]
MKNKILSVVMAVFIILSCSYPLLCVLAEEDVIRISTADEFTEFADKCRMDSFSKGKTVYLENDIKLNGLQFKSIPVFYGVFDGQGYTLSGISFISNASNKGVFRYIEQGAIVKNLNVTGVVTPGGTSSKIGGIAGTNSGSILSCTFNGTVKGSSYVGMIAGMNLSDGVISNCSSRGTIYAEHYVGGITGHNTGRIVNCENAANVNTRAEKVTFDIEKIDFDRLISTQNTVDITDLGGICGYSSGVVEGCTNYGRVGYRSVGYNVGGIAGRQSGYLNNCKNHGQVNARKDAGGIVGQMEYYTYLKYSEDSISNLNTELDKLKNLTNTLLDNTDSRQIELSNQLTSLKSYADSAISNGNIIKDKTTDMLNSDIDSINDAGVKLSDLLTKISDELDSSNKIADNFDSFIDCVQSVTDTVDESINIDRTQIDNAGDLLKEAADKVDIAVENLSKATKKMRSALYDTEELIYAVEGFVYELDNLLNKLSTLKSDLEYLDQQFDSLPELLKNGDFKELITKIEALKNYISGIRQVYNKIISNISELKYAFENVKYEIARLDFDNLFDALDYMVNSLEAINGIGEDFSEVIDSVNNILDGIDFDNLNTVSDDITKANDALSEVVKGTEDTIRGIKDAIRDFSKDPIITIEKISDEYINALDNLSNDISGISDVLGNINSTTSSNLSSIKDDFKAVTDQIFVVFDTMSDMIDDSFSEIDIEEHITDVSDEDTVNQTTGKVSDSKNYGKVEADLNVGGICGTMAVEYDFDPEDDVVKSGEKTRNFLYTLRAIIRACDNYANVTAKKNYVGGIVGNQALGCVINSNGRGNITSKNGDYVGGVAGLSESTIKNCNAKVTLSGDDFVGGIAGKGKNIFSSRSLVNIEDSDENLGAIAGELTGTGKNNYFTSDTLGGIDSISYAGIAEPCTVEELAVGGVNSEIFNTVTVSFFVEDRKVRQIEIGYKESIDEKDIPEIPKQDGKHSKWSNSNFTDIEHDFETYAEYYPSITSIESSMQRNALVPVIVAEGEFSEDEYIETIDIGDEYKPAFSEKQLESWEIKTSDGANITALRYLPPDNSRNISIMMYKGNKFVKAETTKDGSYLVIDLNDAESNDIKISVVTRSWVGSIIYYVSNALEVIAVLLILLFVIRRINNAH